MYGLIIKKKWLDKILSGEKTIEVRGSNTKHVGERIFLLESGTHLVRGTCIIMNTFSMSCSDWCKEAAHHCVNLTYKELTKKYQTPYAWQLTDVKDLSTNEFYYDHPKGAVIWVKDVKLHDCSVNKNEEKI